MTVGSEDVCEAELAHEHYAGSIHVRPRLLSITVQQPPGLLIGLFVYMKECEIGQRPDLCDDSENLGLGQSEMA